ncbi:hypothetical protein MMC22_008314 [Lobaria immixta]|nr:hypothetical protein [Lobaria immixta]
MARLNKCFIMRIFAKLGTLLLIAARNNSGAPQCLTLVDYSHLGCTDLLRKPATDNLMMGLEEVGFVIIGRGGEAGAEISSEESSALLKKAETETQAGFALWVDKLVVVGRK